MSLFCILIPLLARRRQEENSLVFPFDELLQLERRVGKDQWSIPYKREESLGRCLLAATRLAKEGESHGERGERDCGREAIWCGLGNLWTLGWSVCHWWVYTVAFYQL